jgi:mono/diheme cytochrome c family protein
LVTRLPALFLLTFAITPTVTAQATPQVVPRDTVDEIAYDGWKQYSLHCARCHGEDAQGTSFGPSLLLSMRPEGAVGSREAFMTLLSAGRPERGMPSATTLGMDTEFFEGVYIYLAGRSAGRLHGGRPVRRGG